MTCCFIGHRKIEITPALTDELDRLLQRLIAQNVTQFLFGDHSAFDSLCYRAVTELKKNCPQIRRIRFRTDYPDADPYTERLLRTGYEDCICPAGAAWAGRAAYLIRNQAMIRESDICIFYCDEKYLPRQRGKFPDGAAGQPQSGTKLAFDYAKAQKKKVINLFHPDQTQDADAVQTPRPL